MGKTICLLIAIALFAQAEYVKSLQPVLSQSEQNSSKIKNANSRIRLNSKAEQNASKAENSRIPIKLPEPQKAQNPKNPNAQNFTNTSGFSKNSTKKSFILNPAKSDEYIFWAHFFTTNQMLSTRVLAISKAMKKSDESEFLPLCELKATKQNGQSELDFFHSHEEEIADCFTKSPFKVLEYSLYELNSAKQKAKLHTNITQIPIHFIAIFKAQGATILAKILSKE